MKRLLTIVRAAAALVMLGVTVAMLASTLPALFGNESFVVSNASMQPALGPGDLVVVQPVRVDELTAGDVIAYRTAQEPLVLLTRRVLFAEPDGVGGRKLQVRGDSEPSSEQVIVSAGTSLGRMALSVPRVGALVTFGNSWLGRGLLLGLPLVLLALDALLRRLRSTPRPLGTTRVSALLDSGQRALAAGYPQLAVRAADGALALEPNNATALVLKRIALRVLLEKPLPVDVPA